MSNQGTDVFLGYHILVHIRRTRVSSTQAIDGRREKVTIFPEIVSNMSCGIQTDEYGKEERHTAEKTN